MLINQIDQLIDKIYNGDLNSIDVQIIDVLTLVLSEGVVMENDFLNIVKIVNDEIVKRNYVYIADILEFELKKMIMD